MAYDTVVPSEPNPAVDGDEPEYIRPGLVPDQTKNHERTGVTHLVHVWFAQGHPVSDYMVRSCKGAGAVKRYYHQSQALARSIGYKFSVSFPHYHTLYSNAFKKGAFYHEDPGPFLGRAIVWKLQVGVHVDGQDEGPTAIFNSGDYEGGDLYLPDLKLKLAYRPGDVVILMSGCLYHAVSEWKPTHATPGQTLTPGRVGNVFFFPHASYEALSRCEADSIHYVL
ncbi:hypothetical protein BDN72DRAFT_768154 [Pluteus cervinus]|uniref:Uncharacterized protein n=1 Tax=Pluteus cervinus TaxID=181527 RepID=A0ACD3AU55_9AGAR|nr:hypothetical protein BDN72DRAFT_768154 [Pluteus cervinus]